MKHLLVHSLPGPAAIHDISGQLDALPRQGIEMAPWAAFPARPRVSFAIAYSGAELYLKYYVEEVHPRAVYTHLNDPVYKDSCVEFFVSLGGEPEYYNFEFNFAGACLLGFGKARENRLMATPRVLPSIRTHSAISHAAQAGAEWTLTLALGPGAFYCHNIRTFQGMHARANFYKCGDELPERCYLSWNDVDTAEPDFHVPRCFGSVEFR